MERGKNFWLVGGVVGGLTFIALIFLAYLVYRLVESHQLMRFMTVDYELEHIDEKAAWVGTTLGGVVGLRVALTGECFGFRGGDVYLYRFLYPVRRQQYPAKAIHETGERFGERAVRE